MLAKYGDLYRVVAERFSMSAVAVREMRPWEVAEMLGVNAPAPTVGRTRGRPVDLPESPPLENSRRRATAEQDAEARERMAELMRAAQTEGPI